MATIYSGIQIKLKNSKTPWVEKIKLAHFAWISQQCFIPNKEQILLDWVSQSLVGYYTKKLDLEDDDVMKLWSFLDSILHSKKLQSLVKEGKSLNLRFTIAQVINDFIGSYCSLKGAQAGIGTVLSCCQGILSTPALAFVYTAKCELMVELLSKLSTLAFQYLTSSEPIKPQIFDILYMSFSQYLQLQRQQINPNRVFGQVIAQLCQPCLLLRHALNNRSWSNEDDSRVRHQLSKDIRNKTETILQMGIFPTELLSSYKEELLPEIDQLKKKKGLPKVLFTPVNSLLEKLMDSTFCETAIHISVICNSLPVLYKLFLDTYCRDGNQLLCFYMLAKLIECVQECTFQKEVDLKVSSCCSTGLFALEQLLNLALSHNIYNVAVDRIRHQEVQYRFYCKLSEMLLRNPNTSVPAWFRCLKTLILFNHVIIERNIHKLVSCAWIDVDILDTRVRKAQDVLISNLFQTYAKLRQFPKLFEEVLIVICQPATDELRPLVLSPKLTASLTESLLELSPKQILDIWSMILDKFHTFILPDIKNELHLSLKLVSLSSLIHCLLFNIKIMDNNTPLPVLLRFQILMGKMMEWLIQPLLKLVKDHCAGRDPKLWLQNLYDATLLLLYTWIEVDARTGLNCSSYTCKLGEISSLLYSSIQSKDMPSFFEIKECWEKVVKISKTENSVSKYCMGLLSIQQIKNILMEKQIPSEDDLLTLKTAASFLLHLGEFIMPKEHASWNGSPNSVNNHLFVLAHWHLIASNLPIIHPYISAEDTNCVAGFLLETLIGTENEDDELNHDQTSVTFRKVSASLLHSVFFPEMCFLQSAFLTSIIKRCSTILHTSQNVLSEIFSQISEKSLAWHEDFFSSSKKGALFISAKSNETNDKPSLCWINMNNAAQNILHLAKTDHYTSLSDIDIANLLGLFKFISVLKPDSLAPSDQSRSFLLLLLLARAEQSPMSLHFTTSCYKLLSCVIRGKHSNAVFKLMYASDFLEIIMRSLLTANWELVRNHVKIEEWQEFVHAVYSFLESFLVMIIEKKQSILLNLETFMAYVTCSIPNSNSPNWNTSRGHLLLVALNTLCRAIISCLQEQHVNKQRTESFYAMLQKVVVELGMVVNRCLKGSILSQLLPSFLVKCVTTLLEAELIQLSLKETFKQSSSFLDYKEELENVELYRRVCTQILREISHGKDQTAFLKSAFHYLTVCITVKECHMSQHSMVITIFRSLKKLLTGPWTFLQIIHSFEAELTELFTQLVSSCDSGEFNTIMKLTLKGIEACNLWENGYKEPSSSIAMIRLLLNCPLHGDHGKLFWSTVPQIITALVILSKEACKDHLLIPSIVVPILETMSLLLRQGEIFLTNPHYVTLTFSILLNVPLDHLKIEDYYNMFFGVHEVLFAILQCHPKAMLKAVPSFLRCFHRLLTSVMYEGQQKEEKGTTNECEVLLNCVRLVERMYTHIAAKTEEFTVFSTFLVSQYVNELQKVTLYPAVKKHLTEGIFHILDLCIERDIKFLNASLQMGVREVFKELYNQYIHYHKTMNQGDVKYKA